MLPVATFAYLYHTVSGLTLLRYWRLCETLDAPTEQREVVREDGRSAPRHDPLFETILEEPLPLEETPESGLLAAAGGAGRPEDDFRREFDQASPAACRAWWTGRRATRSARRGGARDPRLARAALSDDEAIALVLDPSKNPLLGETLTLTTQAKLSRALFHPSYTFRKRLSHTADSQDQRHRMTPASRPALPAYLSDEPDYIVPMLVPEVDEAYELYRRTMARDLGGDQPLRSRGVPDEYAAYLLPNAVALRFTESADLLNLHHKFAMRLCYNAQEEIWRASLDEALQIPEVNPPHRPLAPAPVHPPPLRAGPPVCPEGDRFCGVVVWKQDAAQYVRTL